MTRESQVAFWKATKFWLTLLLAAFFAALFWRIYEV